MGRRVRDFIEISDYTSLDSLINTLVAIRDNLPEEAEPELKLRGDDVFGRRITIAYLRELTVEEAECDARYTGGVIEPERYQMIRACLDMELQLRLHVALHFTASQERTCKRAPRGERGHTSSGRAEMTIAMAVESCCQ